MNSKKNYFVLLLCISTGSFAQKTIFTGNFMIDRSRYDFGPAPEWILPRYIKVQQEDKRVIIGRIQLNQQLEEQPMIMDTLDFNGTPYFSLSKLTGSKTRVTAKWLNEQSLQINKVTLTAEDKPSGSVTEIWTLQDEGKTLFVNRSVEQANGMKYAPQVYYNRK